MTIRPNITVTRHSRKIHPVPRKRQFAAGKLLGFVTIQRCIHLADLRRSNIVATRLGPANPFAQMIYRKFITHGLSIPAICEAAYCSNGHP